MTYNPDAVPAEEPIDWDNVTLVPKDGEDTAQTEIQEELTLAPIETSGEGIESAKEEIGEISHETSPSPEVVAAQAAAEAEQIETLTTQIHEQISPTPKIEEKVTVAPKPISLGDKLDFYAPRIYSGNNSYVQKINEFEYSEKAIREVSDGVLKYEKNKGITFEGKTEVLPDQARAMMEKLREAESNRGNEAFEYVKNTTSNKGENEEEFSLDDSFAFGNALCDKRSANEKSRAKIYKTTLGATTASGVGGIAGAYLTGSVAGGTALIASPFIAAAAPWLIGASAVIAGGGLIAQFGKKLYDGYKERKAEKDFMVASVARKVCTQFSRG